MIHDLREVLYLSDILQTQQYSGERLRLNLQNFLDEYLNFETNTEVREKAQLIVLPYIYFDKSEQWTGLNWRCGTYCELSHFWGA